MGTVVRDRQEVRNVVREGTRAEAALRGLAEAAMALSACRSLDEVLRTITDRARDVIGAHMAVIGTSIDRSWAQSIQTVSLSNKYAAYRDFEARPDGSGIYSIVCDLNRPMRLTQAELEAHPAWRGFGEYVDRHPRLRGWLAVPLIDSDGRNMGLLQLSDKERGDFTAEDEGIAVQLAQMASLAIGEARLHESLANSERHFRLLAEAIPQHVCTFGADGTLTYCNQRWSEYTGLTLQAARAVGWETVFHPDEADAVVQAWQECCAHGTPYEREVRVRRVDGQYRHFLTRAVPISDDEGKIVQWFWTNTDIEESKLAAEALHKALAELARVTQLTTMGELAASLAHELNQPLAAAAANAAACLRWLSRDHPEIHEAMEAARRIIDDANRAGNVIKQTRALLTKTDGERAPLDVAKLIREVLILVRPELKQRRIVLRETLTEDLPRVVGSRIQLQQVVLNLIMNGIEAMTEVTNRTRELTIGCRRQPHEDGSEVLVTVEDAGVGVAPEDAERIFEAFYTTKAEGLGMGLAISRSIVEAHGGRLWVTAKLHHGATFHVMLPASHPA